VSVEQTDSLRVQIQSVSFSAPDTGFHVLRCVTDAGAELTCAGVIPFPVYAGESLRVKGQFEIHERHGRQFVIQHVVAEVPVSLSGISAYIRSRGVKGIGKVGAQRIADTLGANALQIIRQEPRWWTRVRGLSGRKGLALTDALCTDASQEQLFVRLSELGVSSALAQAVFATYGASALAIVERDPWALAQRVTGFGFRRADDLAMRLGLGVDAPSRLRAALLHVLSLAMHKGHTGLPPQTLLARARQLCDVSPSLLASSLATLVEQDHLLLLQWEQTHLVCTRSMTEAETRAAARLRWMAQLPARSALTQALSEDWTEEQRAALCRLAPARLGVLTGGPGTGKTTVLRELVAWHLANGRKVALASPTGRAARRLSESTGHEALTLHRLLGVTPEHLRPTDGVLDGYDILIIDEASMLDLVMLACLMEALPERTSLLLVGDVDQLPSIGPGSVLRDIIASGLASVARLTRVHRQAEGNSIIANTHRVLVGEDPHFDKQQGHCFFMRRDSAAEGAETIAELVLERLPRSLGLDPLRDIQVLTPKHDGAAGTIELNRLVQQKLHGDVRGLRSGAATFAVGDRIICSRNDPERDVMNGDIGIVTKVNNSERSLNAEFNGVVREWRGAALNDLAPAFAITVHKAQGSEYPCVILALFMEHFVMLQRHLLYTAMSRARGHLIVVGQEEAIRCAVRDARTNLRHGLLAARLKGASVHTLSASEARSALSVS